MSDELISSSNYAYLGSCPATLIAVEQSFSMLKELLAKDRNLKKEIITKYFFCYCIETYEHEHSESSEFDFFAEESSSKE